MEYKISSREMRETLNIARTGSAPEAVEALQKLALLKCKKAVPTVIARLSDKDPQLRLTCTQECAAILGKSAARHLAARLSDKVIEVGMVAAEQLAILGTRQAAEELVKAAASEDPIIQTHGTYGLSYWTSKAGVPVLRKAVIEPGFPCPGAAAMALGQIGVKRIPGELTSAFNRVTNEVERMEIAAALTLLGSDQREIIHEGLRSQWSTVKLSALGCALAINDKEAFLDIVPLLRDRDSGVSSQAENVLESLGLTQKEKRFITRKEAAKYDLRKSLPEGYQLEADE